MRLMAWKTRLIAAALVFAAGTAAVSAYAEGLEYFRTDTPEFMASAKQGKQLFQAYQCALCHATREGQALTKDIIAPNLILAKDRLRPEWILEWIIDPQKLQPGTKMPNFFSFNTDDNENNIYTDADAHTQFKMITSLRDYLMILGTDKEAQLDKVDDAGMPIASAQRSAAPAAAPPAAEPSGNGAAPEAAAPGDGAADADAAAQAQ
jgi:cytochrome c2